MNHDLEAALDGPVTAAMTRDPVTVGLLDPLELVRRAMTERGFHHVPVMSGGRLVGMVSATDLLRVSAGVEAVPLQAGADAPPGTVRSLMVRDVVTLQPEASLRDALAAFADGRFHALPVVAPDGQLLGLLTTTDLVRCLGAALGAV